MKKTSHSNSKNTNNNNNDHHQTGSQPQPQPRRGRVRGRDQMGVGGAMKAIQNYDYEQKMAAAREKYKISKFSSLPPPNELHHWKINPQNKEQLMCDLEGGKWKIVLSEEQLYDTCVMEFSQRKWKSFTEYKGFMLEKYYMEEFYLDCLLKSDKETKTDGNEDNS